MRPSRDPGIDIVRGVAIVTMVAANLAGPILTEPHPLALRLYGSFAAPIFVLLSGMMVRLSAETHGRRFGHFVERGATIVTAGALVDVLIWQIYPFTTVDVLYLIGVSVPLAALLRAAPPGLVGAVAIVIFLSAPLLQSLLGYTPYPTEVYLWGVPTVVVDGQTGILRHWLIDGFFPLVPWLGFAVLGVILAGVPWHGPGRIRRARASALAGSLALVVVGCALWQRWPGPLLTRGGYSEMFYPPTVGYVVTALGLIGLLFWIVDWRPGWPVYDPLKTLGESSLAMYILHLVAIRFAVKPVWPRVELSAFVAIYVALLVVLVLAAYGLRVLKARWRPHPLVLATILGG